MHYFPPVLTKELLEIGKSLTRETISLQITTFQAMLPQVLKATYKKEIVRSTQWEIYLYPACKVPEVSRCKVLELIKKGLSRKIALIV